MTGPPGSVRAVPNDDAPPRPPGPPPRPPRPEGNIGGRYGSPSITVALPFSNIHHHDEGLVEAVVDVCGLVARLCTALDGPKELRRGELDEIRRAATALAERLNAR